LLNDSILILFCEKLPESNYVGIIMAKTWVIMTGNLLQLLGEHHNWWVVNGFGEPARATKVIHRGRLEAK
jgi:hypothetical protein